MLSTLFTTYQQTLQMMLDSSKALSYRLPLWHPLANTPESLGLNKWFTVWSISQEQLVAYQHACWLFQTEVVKISQTAKHSITLTPLELTPIFLTPKTLTTATLTTVAAAPITLESPNDKKVPALIENNTEDNDEPATTSSQYSLL